MNLILMSRSRRLARFDFFLALLLSGIRRRQSFQAINASQAAQSKNAIEAGFHFKTDAFQRLRQRRFRPPRITS
jgi:hypothetical protein